jgi:hypothetical protein
MVKGQHFMRSLIIAALLVVTGAGYVSAEVAVPSRPSAGAALPSSKAAEKSAHESGVANCVQMWDRGTHMTEQQWLRTCKRVQDRLQHLQMKLGPRGSP